ncbi:MAG: DUF1667 domain-containing protein [Clostridia bacterium]
MTRNFVCIVCPNGCELTAHLENGVLSGIEGGLCKRGSAYVESEMLHPVRTVTTLVRVRNGQMPLTSVRLDAPIPQENIFSLVERLKNMVLNAPVHIGQVVLDNVFGSRANVIVTKNVETTQEGKC